MDPGVVKAASSSAEQLAQTGVLGSLVVILLIALWLKDRELQKLNEKNLNLVVTLQEKVILAVTKIADLMEFLEKKDRDLERAREEGSTRRGGGR